jgi:hypothetical protein
VRQTLEHLRVEDMLFKDTTLPVHAGPLFGQGSAPTCAPCRLASSYHLYASLVFLVLSWLAWQAM